MYVVLVNPVVVRLAGVHVRFEWDLWAVFVSAWHWSVAETEIECIRHLRCKTFIAPHDGRLHLRFARGQRVALENGDCVVDAAGCHIERSGLESAGCRPQHRGAGNQERQHGHASGGHPAAMGGRHRHGRRWDCSSWAGQLRGLACGSGFTCAGVELGRKRCGFQRAVGQRQVQACTGRRAVLRACSGRGRRLLAQPSPPASHDKATSRHSDSQ